MPNELTGTKIAFLTANEGVEQVELTSPRSALESAGAETTLIAPRAGDVQGFNHLTKADTFEATVTTADADVDDYDGPNVLVSSRNPDDLPAFDEQLVSIFAASN